MRLIPLSATLVCLLGVCVASAAPAGISVRPIPSPADGAGVGPCLTRGPDGTVWMSWIEPKHAPADAGKSHGTHTKHEAARETPAENTLRLASLGAAATAWGEARDIAHGTNVAASGVDSPVVAIDGSGGIHAIWPDGRGGALTSRSADQGRTWSTPVAWSSSDAPLEMLALIALADGRLLAAWLDGRGYKAGGKAQHLYARTFGDGRWGAERLVDASVCDCCPLGVTPFLDGGALLMYRDRAEGEVRDIVAARLRDDAWQEPQPVSRDGWTIAGCPVNGPRVASDGSRVAAAWFTAAGGEPRVHVTFSTDAGQRWLSPLRVDRGNPAGRVDTVLLRSGSILVTWVENDGSAWLCRVTPEFTKTEPMRVAEPGEASTRAAPRLVLLGDYAGGSSVAKLVLAVPGPGPAAVLRTLLVEVPEGQLISAERNCNCAPTAEDLAGFPVRGVVEAADLPPDGIRLRHLEVPGVMAGGTHVFAIDPALRAQILPGSQLLGRIVGERNHWRLVGVRQLGQPAGSGGRP